MSKSVSASGLAQHIQKLLDEREALTAAIEKIDQTLEKVGAALSYRRPGRPAGSVSAPAKRGRRRGTRNRFALSGEASITAFIKQRKNPTTKEINKHWKGEGRGGSADNALTKLVKLKQLKRERIEGERGSRYMVA